MHEQHIIQCTYIEARGPVQQLNNVTHGGLAGLREVLEQLLDHVQHNGLASHELAALQYLQYRGTGAD